MQPCGYITGTVKVNGILARRQVWVINSDTKQLITSTISRTDNGKYQFEVLHLGTEYDIIASDYKRDYLNSILTAVKPKTYP